MRITSPSDRWTALALGAVMFVIYNANGREIGNYDSQPTKFAARELLLRGSLSLNYVVGATPLYLKRSGFMRGVDGSYHSSSSPTSSIVAAVVAWPLVTLGVIDLKAPLAPGLIAALSASLLTSIAVALAYLTICRLAGRPQALLIAVGLGVGTGYWSTVSQTLWQHECAVVGLALAVFALVTDGRPGVGRTLTAAAGMGLAGTARPQLAIAIAVLVAATFVLAGIRRGLLAGIVVGLFAAALVAAHVQWFGHVLGPVPALELLHPSIHATEGSFQLSLAGYAGLLFSPSRGLLVYSPIVLVSLVGYPTAIRSGVLSPLFWCAVAAFLEVAFYGAYTVWWGGHTYGPRYLLDVLPLLAPLAVPGLAIVSRSFAGRALGSLALAWSIAVAATGAVIYPNDLWNNSPADVDRHHERLWDVSDTQIARCWSSEPSPHTFNLFTRDAFRQP